MAFVNNLLGKYLSFFYKKGRWAKPSVQQHERFVHGLFFPGAKKHPPLSPIGQKSGC